MSLDCINQYYSDYDGAELEDAAEIHKEHVVQPSYSDSDRFERDDLFDSQRWRKQNFRLARIAWENVTSWSILHDGEDDKQGEIARIMAQSLKPIWRMPPLL